MKEFKNLVVLFPSFFAFRTDLGFWRLGNRIVLTAVFILFSVPVGLTLTSILLLDRIGIEENKSALLEDAESGSGAAGRTQMLDGRVEGHLRGGHQGLLGRGQQTQLQIGAI